MTYLSETADVGDDGYDASLRVCGDLGNWIGDRNGRLLY